MRVENKSTWKLLKYKFYKITYHLFECLSVSKHIFNKLVLNHDGSITVKGSKEEKLQWVFDVKDSYGNREITWTEMKGQRPRKFNLRIQYRKRRVFGNDA